MVLSPHLMVGNVIEIKNKLLIIIEIQHDLGTSNVSRVQTINPGRLWAVKYKFKRFWRQLLQPFKKILRRFRSWS